MEEASGSQQCLVCTVSITSTRFGMDACRACSSFFKRSKVTGKAYKCRQGDGKCSTSKDERFTCRGCRFARCIAVGMEYDGPMRVRRKTHVSILKRIKIELKALTERRREQELKIIRQHGGHKRFPHPTEELYYTHRETVMDLYGIFVAESYEFFKKVFPAFSELAEKEQELIFKDYVGKMGTVEGYQRSVQLWGGINEHQTYSVTSCYELGNIHWHGIDENVENLNFLISYTETYAKEFFKLCLPIFNKISFTEQEYYALMALTMYEIDIPFGDLSEEAEEILENYRKEALIELQSHYRNDLCLRDFSARLGNLMSANHVIQEGKSRFKTFYRFYSTMFDVFTAENVLENLYL